MTCAPNIANVLNVNIAKSQKRRRLTQNLESDFFTDVDICHRTASHPRFVFANLNLKFQSNISNANISKPVTAGVNMQTFI